MKKTTTLERIYPGSKVRGIDQVFVKGVGWYDTLIDQPQEAMGLIKKGVDLAGRKIEVFALILEDDNGFRRIADFKRDEILYY